MSDVVRERPNTLLIAHEDGDHQRLSRAAAKAIDRAEAAEEALEESLHAIHATEKLGDIERSGYPRPKQEAKLHAIIDRFLDKRRDLLSSKGGET